LIFFYYATKITGAGFESDFLKCVFAVVQYLYKKIAMQKMPETIEEVLQELDRIIDQTVAANNFLGIFAYVYRRTTAQIKLAVENKTFEDNARMEKFDVAFANLYLAAYHSYQDRRPLSKSWRTAFDAQSERLTSIQHLIMGMNAHINLDL